MSAKLRMPVKSSTFTLDGDYTGFEFTARTNPKVREIQLTTDGRGIEGTVEFLQTVLTGWNFVNEEGAPIELSLKGITDLPIDLINLMVKVYLEVITGVPGNSETP